MKEKDLQNLELKSKNKDLIQKLKQYRNIVSSLKNEGETGELPMINVNASNLQSIDAPDSIFTSKVNLNQDSFI